MRRLAGVTDRFAAVTVVVVGTLALTGLAASLPAGAEAQLDVSAGLKVGGGGNLLTEPDNPPGAVPFDDGAGGYAFTFGPFAEARFLEGLVGVQTGLIFDFSTMLSEFDIGGRENTVGWSATDLRIPLLAQVGLPGVGTRLYFATGPEFVFGLSADGEWEFENGSTVSFDADTATRVNWVFDIGFALPISSLRVGFDLQFAINLGAESNYADRVTLLSQPVPNLPLSIPLPAPIAQHNMDLRLLVNVAYDVL